MSNLANRLLHGPHAHVPPGCWLAHLTSKGVHIVWVGVLLDEQGIPRVVCEVPIDALDVRVT